MATILKGGCRVTRMREGEPLVRGTLQAWKQIGRATGAQAISLTVLEFGPGLSPAIQNRDCDQILYLLDGVPSIDVIIDGQCHSVRPDTGIYIRPNETVAIDNQSGEAVTIISSQCPDPDQSLEFTASPDRAAAADNGS